MIEQAVQYSNLHKIQHPLLGEQTGDDGEESVKYENCGLMVNSVQYSDQTLWQAETGFKPGIYANGIFGNILI